MPSQIILFGVEAASTICYLINQSPSTAIEKKPPQEVWSSAPANYSELKIFGCPAYVHVNNGKLEPRSVKCIFLGYKSGVKGYKLWCPRTKKIVISRNVVFDETALLQNFPTNTLSEKSDQRSNMQVEVEIDTESEIQSDIVPSSPPPPPQHFITKDKPNRVIRPPQRYAETDLVAYALSVADEIDSNE